MFRSMRRKDRSLSKEDTWNVINNGKYGVLSILGDDGYPYGVPLHYIVSDGTLYVHGTNEGGHKYDSIEQNPKMSFTIMDMEDDIKGRSVILFGTIHSVPEKREFVLNQFVEKFVPEFAWSDAKGGIPFAKEKICAYVFDIEHVTGKWVDQPDDE